MASVQERILVRSPITESIFEKLTPSQKKKCKRKNGKIFYNDYLPKKLHAHLSKRTRTEKKYWVQYRDSDNKQQSVGPFSNKSNAIKKKKLIEYEIESDLISPINKIEVKKSIELYLRNLELIDRKETTIKRAKQMLEKLELFCEEKKIRFLHEITIDHVEEYKSWSKNRKPFLLDKAIPISGRTLDDELGRFRSFNKYAMDRKWVKDNPFKRTSPRSKSYKRPKNFNPYTEEEINWIVEKNPEIMWKTIWLLFSYAGLRFD
jgi:hypothetical protein